MDNRVRQLQLRIRALRRGHARSQIRYPADLRADIIGAARAARAAGRSIYGVARDLGVSAPTLIEWLRRPTPGRLRQVTIGPAPVKTTASKPSAVLVTPHGLRIEGLDLAGLVTVLRDLA